MNNSSRRDVLGAWLLAFVVGALVGCAYPPDNNESQGERRLRAVATTSIVSETVQRVGGTRVRIHTLMGPGIDPHLYKATEGDVQRIAQADVVFYNGLHLEAKMASVFEKIGKRVRTVAIAEKIPREKLLWADSEKHTPDPHVWFDVGLWRLTIPTICQALSELDPASSETFRQNAALYDEELAQLERLVRAETAKIPPAQRVLITAHDAFRYFGRAYGFEVLGLQGLSTASEAGTADIDRLARIIVERKIRAIFIESSVPTRTVQAVQQAVRTKGFTVAIGGELFSDSLGDYGTPEGTYVGMVRYNVETIVRALKP
ncbi:MAG: zinc ABC transporter substrate-binding protein [Candidatus Sumerlaeaceae bacterium]|nr:zinc ABC transporter substrate-binding protein [Candidatus Sumerlaeaceae bacterium]